MAPATDRMSCTSTTSARSSPPLAVAVPVGVALLVTGALQTRIDPSHPVALRCAAAAGLVLLAAAGTAVLPLGLAIVLMGLVVAGLVVIEVLEEDGRLHRG